VASLFNIKEIHVNMETVCSDKYLDLAQNHPLAWLVVSLGSLEVVQADNVAEDSQPEAIPQKMSILS